MSDTCPTVNIKTASGFARINESDFDPAKYELYIEPPAAPVAPLPPLPVAPPHPLDNLAPNWREREAADLRNLAAVVNAGRMPETKEQAIAVIESAVAKRAVKV